MYRVFFLFLVIIVSFGSRLKSQIAIGAWRDHLPYYNTTAVVEGNNKIYCSSPYALFYYNLADNSLNKLSRSNGLSDIGVSAINYDLATNVLLVAYENANIDIIKETEIFNLSDIKNKPIAGDKRINQVVFSDKLAFLACGFGIVVIDIEHKEIKETYYIGPNASAVDVYSIAFDDTYIYAATGSGIYMALKNNLNLVDYNQWEKISTLPFSTSKYTSLVNFNSEIYACIYNPLVNPVSEIYRQSTGTWELVFSPNELINSLRVFNNKLYVTCAKKISILNSSLIVEQEITSYGFANCEANDVYVSNNNVLYIGDKFYSLVVKSDGSSFQSYIPNSPYNNHVADIDAQANQVVVAGGGHTPFGVNLWNFAEFYSFSDENWLSNILWSSNAKDFSKVLINPYKNSQVYAGAWGAGVYVFENGQLTANYNASNSTLQSILPGEDYVRIGGLLVDQNQNLYVTNPGGAIPLSVKDGLGNWYKYNYPGLVGTGDVGEIIETQDGNKWIQIARGGGLFVFNDNNTPSNMNDDNSKRFSIYDETGELATNEVFSIAEDDNGIIWVGTDVGVFTYFNANEVFTSNDFRASRVKIVDKDDPDYVQYLLAKEKINAIAIDGANRKWFGTENSGVFLMSDDCEQEIFHFTEANSKLLSNNIVSIAIEPKSGEVFIGTDKGICSFKGTATKGDDNFTDAYIYPNPVRENYDGLITITGLAANVDVKITDIAGQIVYQTKAFGGQAIWNGQNHSGRRVKTGVYLVFCTNEDGQKKKVLKLLFIN
jgi:hypothetical protein